MKQLLLASSLALICFTVQAQSATDTIYYDKAWKETKAKYIAAYYRLIRKEGKLLMVEDHYKNGQLQMTGSYASLEPEVQEGLFKYYDEKGKLSIERNFVNNQMMGDYKKYYPSGKLHWQIHYKKGINDGPFVVYYETGATKRRDEYANGVMISGKTYTATGADTSYFPFEQQPAFVGGDDSLARYIDTHIEPIVVSADEPRTTVYVGFYVDEKGRVVDVQIIKGGNPTFQDAARKVIKGMPNWIPGTQDDKVVKMPVTLPIKF